MKGFLKILIIVFAAVIVLFVAAFAFVRFTLNEQQIRSMAERAVSQALARPVELGRIRFRLGWGIKVDISDIRVANAEGFSSEPMLYVNKAQLALRLVPLLRRQIVVDEVQIRELRLLVERNKENRLNLPAVLTNPPDSSGPAADQWQLQLSRIELKDGIVDYRDSMIGARILVSNISEVARFSADTITVAGLCDLEAFLPGGSGSVFLKIVNDLTVKPKAAQFVINALDIAWPPTTVKLTGFVNKGTELDLEGKLVISEFDRLVALADAPLAKDLKVKGTVEAAFAVRGNTAKPSVTGRAELTDLSMTYQPFKGALSKINGDLAFTLDRVYDVKLAGKMGNVNIQVAGSIDSLSSPRLNLALGVDGDLGDLKGSFPDIEKMGVAGKMTGKINVTGRSDRIRLSGSAAVANGQINNLAGVKPVTDLAMNCDFKNDTITLKQMSFKIVESDMNIQGKILGLAKPRIDLSGSSRRFNLDEVLIPQKGTGGGGQGKPPELDLAARINIEQLQFYNIQSRRAKATVDYHDGKLNIRSTSFDAYEGQVTGEADFDFNAVPVAHRINVSVSNTEAKMILKQFTGFEALAGRMSGRGQFSGTGFTPRDMKTTFNAEGHAALRNGSFVNFNFLTKLLTWLALGEAKTVNFQDLGTEFKIQNGRVRFDDFICGTKIGDFLLFGTMGFDGDIDYKINLTMNKEQSDKIKAAHGDWLFYTDTQGRTVIDILATGNLIAPQFKLDTEKIKNRLEKKIEGETKKQVEDVKKKLKEWWKKR